MNWCATRFHANSFVTHSRPMPPICLSMRRSQDVAARNPCDKPSTVDSTHHPQPRCGSSGQGAPVVVSTGTPWASASATTNPKFSEWDGRMNRSAAKKASCLLVPVRGPANETACVSPTARTACSTSTRWPPSSGPTILRFPTRGPHPRPRRNQHGQTLFGVNATEEKRRLPATVGKICTTDAGFRTAFRQIHAIGDHSDSFGGRKPANICSFTGGSRMKTIGPHQVAMLIEPPREAFSPPLVVDGPGLKHATRADNPWNAAHDREPGETMVMRQPNPVVMDDICSPKCVQGFALRTGDAQQVAVRWQNRRGQCRTIRSPYRYPSSGLRQCQG